MTKKYGFSFSWKRLLGISGLERKIGRTIINILFKKK